MSLLRVEFIRLLTEDSLTRDRRRKDYNQAIFDKDGPAIWSEIDLEMVMDKFDEAIHNLEKAK